MFLNKYCIFIFFFINQYAVVGYILIFNFRFYVFFILHFINSFTICNFSNEQLLKHKGYEQNVIYTNLLSVLFTNLTIEKLIIKLANCKSVVNQPLFSFRKNK